MAASTACTVPKAQGARQWRVSSKMVTMMHGSSRPLVPALVARRTHAAQVCASNPTRVQNVPRLAPATPWRPPLVHWRLSPCAAASSSGAPQDADAQFLGIPSLTWQKVIPLGVTFFGILFNYTLLRNTKDVLVVTAPGSGAETIPFLKTWVNLPSAIAFTVIFAKMSSAMSPESCFYTIMVVFLSFFAAFALFVYPNLDALHPHKLADRLLEAAPRAAIPIAILRNWSFAAFYVFAEMWGSVVTGLLFWGSANAVCTVDEAQTFYPLFGLGANVSLVVAGAAASYFAKARASLPPGVDGWEYSLRGLMALVVLVGLLVTAAYTYLMRVVKPKLGNLTPLPSKKKKKKAKMSVGESFAFLASSPYIRNLAMLVVSYGISINLVEVTWKAKLKAQYPDPNDYSQFMAQFSSATGVVTFSMMLLSRWIFSRFGWGTAALITPVVLLATGIAFFGCVLFGGPLEPSFAAWGVTPLYAAVLVGAAQNIFSKAAKYSLFDPCKEMAYIPLEPDTQIKGKAAIDVVCSPLGKSGGSLIQQVLILTFGSLAASTPVLAAILGVIVLVWINAATRLSGLFAALQAERLEEQRVVAEVAPVSVDGPNGANGADGVTAPADSKVDTRKVAGALYGRALSRSLSSKSNRGGSSGLVALVDDEEH